MALRLKLSGLRREVEHLQRTAPPAADKWAEMRHVGFALLALSNAVRTLIASRLPPGAADLIDPDYVVAVKEAERLGIEQAPRTAPVLKRLRCAVVLRAEARRLGASWEALAGADEIVRTAASAALAPVMESWRPWPGFPPVEAGPLRVNAKEKPPFPEWYFAIGEGELLALECQATFEEVCEFFPIDREPEQEPT